MLQKILSMLNNVKQHGDSYMACCPAHDDQNPSLSIKEEKGTVLVKCFAGCTTEQICGALGIEKKDLFSNEPKRNYIKVYRNHKGNNYRLLQCGKFIGNRRYLPVFLDLGVTLKDELSRCSSA